MASHVVNIASNTTDVQAVTGSCTLVGYSTVTAAGGSTIALHDGTSTSGVKKVADSLAAGNKVQELPAIPFSTGIFVDRGSSNAVELILYLA